MENNAMLKETLTMQTELLKMMQIINAHIAAGKSDKYSKQIEILTEDHRAQKVDLIRNLLPIHESMSFEKLQSWVTNALASGTMTGTKEDYDAWAEMGKIPIVHTASHD